MQTAFVTGGTGFVGLNIIALLKERGARVVAIHRKSSNTKYLSQLGAELRECGLEDPAALARAVPDGTDVVFHVAGDLSWWRPNGERQRRVNVDGTRHVVQAALERKVRRFIHTSTIGAYGLGHEDIDETTISTAAQSPIGYVRTKWQGEEEVRKGIALGLDPVILNPCNIMGPYDTTSWGRLFRLMKAGRLPGVPPGRGSFVHVREVARAHVEAVARGRKGENYILGGTDASYVELAVLIGELVGKKPPRAVAAPVLKTVAWIQDAVSRITRREPDLTFDLATSMCSSYRGVSTKATRELGFQAVPLREMAEDSFRWLQKEGLV
jgi:nucleoside-diphosphate-sugar epimerase